MSNEKLSTWVIRASEHNLHTLPVVNLPAVDSHATEYHAAINNQVAGAIAAWRSLAEEVLKTT
jgi:hypothetical protein